ncbi:MAG: hypothetical protein HY553_09400 [Elusimicrobia bacterium]|nr:hypothetical protein [Elusimicrobiota bacterium]
MTEPVLPDIGGKSHSKPGLLIGAGVVCGMLAFSLLFAPILPVDPEPQPRPELAMPERAAAPVEPRPARQSLVASLLPAAAPAWLTGGPGRASIASVIVAKAQAALGIAPAKAPAGFDKPGEPEPLKAAGESAFRASGKLQRVAAPAGMASTGASASAAAPAAKLGLVPSSVGEYPPVDGARGGRITPSRTADTTKMVKVGPHKPASAAGPVHAHGALTGGAGPATGARESSVSATGLARVPDAVAARGRETYRGPRAPEQAAKDDAHDVSKLDEIKETGNEMNARAILSSFFINLGSAELTRRLQAMQDQMCTNAPSPDCDLTHICIEAGLYDACKRSLQATCAQTDDPTRCQAMLGLKVPPDPPALAMDPTPCQVTVGSCWNNMSVRFGEPGQTITTRCTSPAGVNACTGGADANTVGANGRWESGRCTLTLGADHVGTWTAWIVLGSGARSNNVTCAVTCPAGQVRKNNPIRCEAP